MANVVVVGAQWGDEGKGKIVDWLSERADIVARFQGGHNAGHTLVIDGNVYKLSLLPSGIVRGGKLSVIGNGVVLDPWALLSEIDKLRGQGVEVNPDNLLIAENTPLILPVHGELDRPGATPVGRAKIRHTRPSQPTGCAHNGGRATAGRCWTGAGPPSTCFAPRRQGFARYTAPTAATRPSPACAATAPSPR